MTLSEKLYNLRRKQGLSQEGLAEKLDCSRQVISKWENGVTTPDAEMLQKYSDLYGVSIDYLLKENIDEPRKMTLESNPNIDYIVKENIDEPLNIYPTEKNSDNKKFLGIFGLVISLIGCVLLIVFGAIMLFSSKIADKIAQSSMIVIDGTFIAMLVSVLFIVFGAIILIKTMKHK